MRDRASQPRLSSDVMQENLLPDLEVHLIMDNCGTRKTVIIPTWFAKKNLA